MRGHVSALRSSAGEVMATEALGALCHSPGEWSGGGDGIVLPIELAHAHFHCVWRPQGIPGNLGMAWEARNKVRPNPDENRFIGTRLGRFSASRPKFGVRIGILGRRVEMLLLIPFWVLFGKLSF